MNIMYFSTNVTLFRYNKKIKRNGIFVDKTENTMLNGWLQTYFIGIGHSVTSVSDYVAKLFN